MNRPLRLTECFVGILWNVRHVIAIRLQHYWQTVCSRRADLSCPRPRTPTKWRCIFPSLILQFIIPHQRNTLKWRCVSYHFATLKPFGSDCKTGAMNLPLRLAECTLPYICAINGYCGVFADIHFV